MARIQTIYDRHPWQSWFEIYFVLFLIVSIITVGLVKTAVSLAMLITLATEMVLILLYWAFGPGKTIPLGYTIVNGQKIHIRRPVIGFRSCEREFNSREDGYGYGYGYFGSSRVSIICRHYEYRRALIRI